MGFIEREEQKSRERNKKLQEDRERGSRVYQENQDRLRLQKTLAMEEKIIYITKRSRGTI